MIDSGWGRQEVAGPPDVTPPPSTLAGPPPRICSMAPSKAGVDVRVCVVRQGGEVEEESGCVVFVEDATRPRRAVRGASASGGERVWLRTLEAGRLGLLPSRAVLHVSFGGVTVEGPLLKGGGSASTGQAQHAAVDTQLGRRVRSQREARLRLTHRHCAASCATASYSSCSYVAEQVRLYSSPCSPPS